MLVKTILTRLTMDKIKYAHFIVKFCYVIIIILIPLNKILANTKEISKYSTRLVLELNKPALISNISYLRSKKNEEIFKLNLTFTDANRTSLSKAKHFLSQNNGFVFYD